LPDRGGCASGEADRPVHHRENRVRWDPVAPSRNAGTVADGLAEQTLGRSAAAKLPVAHHLVAKVCKISISDWRRRTAGSKASSGILYVTPSPAAARLVASGRHGDRQARSPFVLCPRGGYRTFLTTGGCHPAFPLQAAPPRSAPDWRPPRPRPQQCARGHAPAAFAGRPPHPGSRSRQGRGGVQENCQPIRALYISSALITNVPIFNQICVA